MERLNAQPFQEGEIVQNRSFRCPLTQERCLFGGKIGRIIRVHRGGQGYTVRFPKGTRCGAVRSERLCYFSGRELKVSTSVSGYKRLAVVAALFFVIGCVLGVGQRWILPAIRTRPKMTLALTATADAAYRPIQVSRGGDRYTREDVYWLEKIVMAEAESEPYEGKVAVANVVLNRVRSDGFPNSIEEVIFDKGQFEPASNGRLEQVEPNEETIRAVDEALSGRKEVDDDVYYFCNPVLASSRWMIKNRKFVKEIGHHRFYK